MMQFPGRNMRTFVFIRTTTTDTMNTTTPNATATQKPTKLTLAEQLDNANSKIKKLTDRNKSLKCRIGNLEEEIRARKAGEDMGGAYTE